MVLKKITLRKNIAFSLEGVKMKNKEKKNKLHLNRINFILLLIAAIVLVAGYIIMSFNEISLSPILLVFAYAVIIPFALLYQPKKK